MIIDIKDWTYLLEDKSRELKEKYRSYFNTNGSVSGAACMRSRMKKELQYTQLILELLSNIKVKEIAISDDVFNFLAALID